MAICFSVSVAISWPDTLSKARQVTKYNKGFCSKHESPLVNSGINLYYAVNDARSIIERTGDRTAPKASGGRWRGTTT